MRGGALPLLFWGLLLTAHGIVNAIWTGDTIQIAMFSAAVLGILLVAGVLALRSREAIRRGAPDPPARPETIVRASFATTLASVGLAVLLFGLTFGHFLVYFGAGLIVAALGRLLLELRHQRRAARRIGS